MILPYCRMIIDTLVSYAVFMEFACFSVCAWGCNTEHVKV